MNSKNTFLKALRTCTVSLGFSFPVSHAQSETLYGFQAVMDYKQDVLESEVSSCFPKQDFSPYFGEFHEVVLGDTLGGIAQKYDFNYNHLIQILSHMSDEQKIAVIGDLDIANPSSLSIGNKIPLLDPSYIETYSRFQSQFEFQSQYNRLVGAWERGDEEYLEKYYSFHITPSLPQNLGIRKSYEALGSMFSQGYMTGPRSIYPVNEDTPKCAETIKNTLKTFLGLQVSGDFEGLYKVVRKPGLDAWILPQELEEAGYLRSKLLDARDLFNKSFHKNRIAISPGNEEIYKQALLKQLSFLRTEDAVGCIIPTLYQNTGTAQTVFGSYGGRDPNSHLFSCTGYHTSLKFSGAQLGFEANKSYTLEDVLVAVVKYYGVIGRYKYQSSESILESLKNISDFIDIQVYDAQNKQFIPLKFSTNLTVENDINIFFTGKTLFKVGGNILTDGYQVGEPDPWMNKKRMEQRLTPDWIIYASHFFNSPIFHPTSILQVPPSLLDAESFSPEGDISQHISIQKFLDTNYIEKHYDYKGRTHFLAEDPTQVYKNAIAQEEFGKDYSELDENGQSVITRLYSLHSLGLQMLGYHSFGGSSWNPGSTNVNAAIPYLQISGEEEKGKIQFLYNTYVTERKIEYYSMLRKNHCDDMNLPFLRVMFFPGDTLPSAIYQLSIQLKRQYPGLARELRNLDQIKNIHFVNSLFGERISRGNIYAGEEFFIGIDELREALRDVNYGLFEGNFELKDSKGDISFHSQIIETMVQNSDWVLLMKYILANESYVNNSENLDNIFYRVLRVEGLSRRGAKSVLYDLRQSGITEVFNNEVLPSFTDFRIPSTSSKGDFQMRFPNLYTNSYLYKWPAKDLKYILREIIDESGILNKEISEKRHEFPEIVEVDLTIAQEILAILESDRNQVRGREVAEKLRTLMRYDPGNTSNIVGFIISTHLAYELLNENIENFVHLLTISGVKITDLSRDQQSRVMASAARCFNMGAGVCQTAFNDVYINRFLEGLNRKYNVGFEFPQVKRTGGIRNAKIYGRFTFINKHLPAYLKFIEYCESNISLSDGENQALQSLKKALLNIKNNPSEYQKNLFQIFGDTELKEALRSIGLDDFILPTQEENAGEKTELTRTLLADYANPKTIENRVQKPFTTSAEKFAVLLSLSALIGYSIQQFIINPLGYLLIFSPFQKMGESQKILYGELRRYMRRRRKEKLQKEFDAILNTPNNDQLDIYIEQRQKDRQDNLILTNDPSHPAYDNYVEGGKYSLGSDEIIYHTVYRPKPMSLNEYIGESLPKHVREITGIQVLHIISDNYTYLETEYK